MDSKNVICIFEYKRGIIKTHNMATYKKAPPYRRDTHKPAGISERDPIYYIGGQAAIELDKAFKKQAKELGITFPTDKNINK